MTTSNKDIKTKAKSKGVYLWEIADRLKMFDTAFSRKLRRELPADEKQQIFSIIDEIAADKRKGVAE